MSLANFHNPVLIYIKKVLCKITTQPPKSSPAGGGFSEHIVCYCII